jgi:hypothetical protein
MTVALTAEAPRQCPSLQFAIFDVFERRILDHLWFGGVDGEGPCGPEGAAQHKTTM